MKGEEREEGEERKETNPKREGRKKNREFRTLSSLKRKGATAPAMTTEYERERGESETLCDVEVEREEREGG